MREKILLPAMLVTSMLFPVIYLLTPLFSFANYELPQWAHWCGVSAMAAGLWLFWRSHVDLGSNWSPTVEMRKDHEIVRRGVYRRVRHPMYAAIWLVSIGQGLLLDNWLAGWSVVVAFAFMYVLRTPVEEEMMRRNFGQDYEDYMPETGRQFPPLVRRPPAG